MPGSQATISDVTDIINTNLDTTSGGPIDKALDLAKEYNQEFNSEANQTATQTKNIERFGAIAYIRQHLERSVDEDSVGDASAVYEGSELQNAQAQLRSWIVQAGGDTAMVDAIAGVSVDSGRHVTTT